MEGRQLIRMFHVKHSYENSDKSGLVNIYGFVKEYQKCVDKCRRPVYYFQASKKKGK